MGARIFSHHGFVFGLGDGKNAKQERSSDDHSMQEFIVVIAVDLVFGRPHLKFSRGDEGHP